MKVLTALIFGAMISAATAQEVYLSSTTKEVVKLSQSQVSPDVVKNYVRTAPVASVSADEIIHLHKAGVADEIISAMLNRSSEFRKESAAYAKSIETPKAAEMPNVQSPPQVVEAPAYSPPVVTTPVYSAPVVAPAYVAPSYVYPYVYPYPESSYYFSFGFPGFYPYRASYGYRYPYPVTRGFVGHGTYFAGPRAPFSGRIGFSGAHFAGHSAGFSGPHTAGHGGFSGAHFAGHGSRGH